ncbi:MAG TPA: hypothetical protein VF631_10625 [Allosphingosinicella sp.]|jgi:hypothetical protein|uniref:hypothetical protein n=1 Tax=Allosphingosinicella sp. TaxID=2823234 RepID=UPI002F275812
MPKGSHFIVRIMARYATPKKSRPPSRRGEPEGEPVEPSKPNLLSGGAAAELEFDD